MLLLRKILFMLAVVLCLKSLMMGVRDLSASSVSGIDINCRLYNCLQLICMKALAWRADFIWIWVVNRSTHYFLGTTFPAQKKLLKVKQCMGALGKNRVTNAFWSCSFDVTKAFAQAFRCPPPKKIMHNLKLKVRKNSFPQKINGQPSEHHENCPTEVSSTPKVNLFKILY